MSTQLSLSQAASTLKVSEKSIRRYIKSGRIKATLIKGQKGYEYRIDKGQLKEFAKPPRGKNSHKKVRALKKIKKTKNIKAKPTPIFKDFVKPMASVKEIVQKNKEKIIRSENSDNPINYKILYEKLLAKYEHSLMMIGSLEAQLKGGPFNTLIHKTSNAIPADQEDTILELYQLLKQRQEGIEY